MFKQEYKNIKNPAIKVIADYLLTRDDIKANLEKENKSLEEMWSYIVSEAKKKAVNNCTCLSDDEVFGLAVHYYDEDDIEVKKTEAKVTVKKEEKPKVAESKPKKKEPSKKTKEPIDMDNVVKKKVYKKVKENKDQISLFDFLGE